MATENHPLSNYDKNHVPDGTPYKVGIVVSSWNDHITKKLLEGAKKTLLENKVEEKHIVVRFVPGSYELCLGSQLLFENTFVDGIIAIGSVIQGETKHFDYVCSAVAQGIKDVSLKYNKPVSFCVLTDNNEQQAIDRSGGKYGNKGVECAIACLQMIALRKSF
jgi:6,7-dimethyl-8-ribityllumazine synthase